MPAPGVMVACRSRKTGFPQHPRGQRLPLLLPLPLVISLLPFSGSSGFFPTSVYPPQPVGSITDREGRLQPVRQQWGPRAGGAAEAAEQAARQGAAEEKMHLFYRRRVCTKDQTLSYSATAVRWSGFAGTAPEWACPNSSRGTSKGAAITRR